jgi:predicted CopG family antitoxin/rubredoxin
MEYPCPKCNSQKYSVETIEIPATKEVVTFNKCHKCGLNYEAEIERPWNTALRKTHAAREIRFSESEKRSFSSLLLSMIEKQTKILATIAIKNGVAEEDIEEICKFKAAEVDSFEYLIGENDISIPPGV